MFEEVKKSCKALLCPDKTYLVALSGGADSVALLRFLLSQGYHVKAAHCNFHLRGEESNRDEEFCKKLCSSLDVPLHIAHFDTHAYASVHKVSIEMAARELRYDYFHKLLHDLNLEAICVAHHRDDSVETVLLNMVRGTGVNGLCGIRPVNGKVIRPLLGVNRWEIIDYLTVLGQDYVTDSTNMEDDVQRNKIRLNVIPLLRDINPAAVENIDKMSRWVMDATAILEAAVAEACRRVVVSSEDNTLVISIPKLLAEPGSETVLWNLLKGKGFSPVQIEQIFDGLEGQSGREWSSESHSLLIDRDAIIVEPRNAEKQIRMVIPESGTYICDEQHKFRFATLTVDDEFTISRDANCACLDAEKVGFPLTIRTVQTGDWFVPFGMKGRKLLSDFLTDKKFTLFEKHRQLVVTDSAGDIIWVAGLRPDNRFRIDEQTTKALVISLSDAL